MNDRAGGRGRFNRFAGFGAAWFALWALLAFSRVWAGANAIDGPVPHPAIPLLDEAGAHVLSSGKPYSPKTSCGEGEGCHDYAAISHAGHFERGRDEADDDFGKKRGGWSQVFSPGYFGGFNCMGPGAAAKKRPGAEGYVGDFGAAGALKRCAACHNGGGWSELDREGERYDRKPEAAVGFWDGDYYEPRGDIVDPSAPARWDWKNSGVLENDCLMCHADYSSLKIFPGGPPAQAGADIARWMDLKETPMDAFAAWWDTRNRQLAGQGLFREAASALLEFLDIPAGAPLLSFERNGTGRLTLDGAGKPILHWNKSAFDGEGKVRIPMRRFPANDNCWQCHGHTVEQDRRGFWGFGEPARVGVSLSETYKTDVHKGKSFTENNGESRVIDHCNACHTQGIYYRPVYANVDLDADHDFPKGEADIDIRRDLDYRPGAKSCEWCHDQAEHRAIPSGRPNLLEAHRVKWAEDGLLDGYPTEALTRVTQTHLDVVGCQTCHIAGLKRFDGSDVPLAYRYRRAEDGKRKIVPYNANAQFRYFWQDKASGRVLTREELSSVYTENKNAAGETVGLTLKNSLNGAIYEASVESGPFADDRWAPVFQDQDIYGAVHALKRAYDGLLRRKGYLNADARMVWTETNAYLISHNARPAADAVPCAQCHARNRDGTYSAQLSSDGLLGAGNVKVLSDQADPRLLKEGLVVLDGPHNRIDGHKIVVNVADLLYVSKLDPAMSALQSGGAGIASGEFARVSLQELFARLGVEDATERQSIASALDAEEAFAFDAQGGAPAIQGAGAAMPVNPQTESLFSRYRLELDSATVDLSARKAIADAGLGAAASARYSLTIKDESGKVLGDFGGNALLLKLPYGGSQSDPRQIGIVARNGDGWRSAGANLLLVRPAAPGVEGYAILATDRPLRDIALTDLAAAAPSAPSAPGKALLAKAKANAARLDQAARQAEVAAAKAQARARRARAKADAASGADKTALEKAAQRALDAAERALAQAELARSAAERALADYRALANASGSAGS
jgi:hypothetical protein